MIAFVDRQSEPTGTIVTDRSSRSPTPARSSIPPISASGFRNRVAFSPHVPRPMAAIRSVTFRREGTGLSVYDPEPGSWSDPAFLQQPDSASVRVPIAEG